MADVQDDVHEGLVWDQRALTAAGQLPDVRVAHAGVMLPVAGLYPSLHTSTWVSATGSSAISAGRGNTSGGLGALLTDVRPGIKKLIIG
jgi:hypothetical protein